MKAVIGAKYEDTISGFVGVCTARCEYISGCHQALLGPKIGKDGTLPASEWFDEQRLSPVPGTVIKLDNGATKGFGPPAPKR